MASELSYLAITLPPVLVMLVLGLVLRSKLQLRALVLAAFVVLAMTAVFDNLIIWAGIVAYDQTLISGVKLALAPIEDFSYSLVGLILIPLVWELWERRK